MPSVKTPLPKAGMGTSHSSPAAARCATQSATASRTEGEMEMCRTNMALRSLQEAAGVKEAKEAREVPALSPRECRYLHPFAAHWKRFAHHQADSTFCFHSGNAMYQSRSAMHCAQGSLSPGLAMTPSRECT